VIDQSNPDSPLYSVGSFEDLKLRPELLQGVYAMGFNKPSKIQETALPLILGTYGQPQNLIAQSQSGTGKTAAFSLGMLSRVDESKKVTQVRGSANKSTLLRTPDHSPPLPSVAPAPRVVPLHLPRPRARPAALRSDHRDG
jgi:superfamily II DNA/RNA helicase